MLKILGRATSSNVQKLVWLCEEIGLAVERTDIGGPYGGNDQADYLALNPNGLIPTLVDDGFVLWESNSCLHYLASIHAVGTWYPTDLKARARANQWMDWSISTLAPGHVPVFHGLIRTPADQRDDEKIRQARIAWSANMAMLDTHLAQNAYIAGDAITIGDMPSAILSFRWFNLDIKRENHPHLRRWYDDVSARPAFVKHVVDIGLA